MPARIVSTVPSSLPRKIRVLAGSIAACLGSLFVAPQQAEAQLQWDPDGDGSNATFGGDGIWNSTNPFWHNGTTDVVWPNVSPSATIAVFGGTAGEVTLGEAIFANGLTFNTTGYAITGNANTLTLNGTTPTVTVTNVTDTATINAIIAGAGFTKAGLGTLSLEGTASNIFTGTLTASAGTLDLAKSGGAIAVSGNLTVAGAALRVLGIDQIADTSAVTISSGSFALNGFNETVASLTMTGGTFTGSGGTLTLNSTGTALSIRNVNMTGNVVLAGATGGGITFDSTSNGTGTISGNVDLGNVARVITVGNGTAGTDLNISGVISGSAGFNKDGDGALQLSGSSANNYTGTLVHNRGILQLNKSTGNAITGTLDVNPTGTSNNPLVEWLGSNQIEDTATVTLRGFSGIGGGALDIKGFSETISGLTIINNQGSGSAVVQTGSASGGGTLTLLGDVSISGTSTATTTHGVLGISGNRIGGVSGTVTSANVGTLDLGGGTRTFNVSATGNAQIGSRITNGGIIKTGATILVLENASNSFTGLTTVDGGTLRIGAAGALPAGNDFRVFSGTLDFNNTSFTTAATGLVLGGGAASATSTIQTGTGTLTLAGDVSNIVTNNPGTATVSGKLDLGGATRVFNIADSTNAANDATISAVVSGTGFGITKTGNGTLLLSGANTFSGPITANGGLLALGGANLSVSSITVNNGASLAPRAANAIAVNPQINAGGTFQLDTAGADLAAFTAFFNAGMTGISVDGGTILANYATDRTLSSKPVTVGAGGVTYNIAGSYTNFLEGAVTQLRFNGGTQVLSGSGPMVKTGGGRLQFQVANANYSGPITVNDGTLEVGTGALGNNSVTNTLTLNGGNVALSGGLVQTTTLAGGAISTNGSSQTIAAPITLQAATTSYTFLNNFWTDTTGAWNMTLTNVVSGSGNLGVAVNRASYDNNAGQLILQNTGNTISGNITVGKNLNLTSSPASGTGSTIGTASVTLANGKLNLRDNGAGNNGTLSYGNNVTLTTATGIFAQGDIASTTNVLTVDRASGTNTGNTIELGTLTTIGAQTLDFTGSNSYGVRFTGLTTIGGTTTFNTTAGVLTLAGGLSGAAQSFTKSGAGILRILGSNDATYTLAGGVLEVPNEPGAGRSIALPLGVGFSAGYAATQSNLIDHITLDSAGVVALGVDSTFNPDFTGFTGGLRLGGTANATLSGTITPAGSSYFLGGGGASLTLATQNALTGAKTLDVNVNGTPSGTIVLANSNDYTGATSVGGGMTLRIAGNNSLGSNTAISIDNGTLQFANGGDSTGFNTRVLTVGAGGATLDTNGVNTALDTAIAGTGIFTKAGAGTLTLTNIAATFAGKTVVRGGMLSISADTNLGAVPGAVVADQLTLNGGGILATATTTIAGNRGITIGANGTTFEVTGTNNLQLNPILTGANPVAKEGTGTLTINGSSTTGTVSVNNGNLDFTASGKLNSNITAAAGTNVRILGGTDAIGNAITLTLNGNSTLLLNGGATETIGRITGTGTVSRSIAGAHTLTLDSTTATQFDGVIQNGTGTISITKGGTNTLTWTGANSYTGATAINTGSLVVQGAAGALGNTAITVGDSNGGDETLTLGATSDVWTSGPLNRLGDTGSIILNTSNANGVVYNGPAAGSSGNVETVGTLTFSNSRNFFTINPGDSNDVQVTTGTLTRSNQGIGIIRGANLAGTGAGSTRLMVTNTPTLVGANGADGSTTKSIVPFVIGDDSSTGVGSGFLTTGANGLRLLTAAEYDSTILGATPLRNVSLSGGETVATSSTVNSIRIAGGAISIGAGQSLRVQSGAILFTGSGSFDGNGTLDASAGEAILTVANSTAANVAVNTRIAAVGGLTISGSGGAHTVTLSGDNDITGTVVVNGGVTVKLGSSQALNDNYPAAVAIRPGGAVQLNGNDVTIRNLATAGGSGTFTNGAATAATLTTYLTAGQTISQGLSNGSTGVLNLIVGGGQTLSMTSNSTYTGFTELRGANIAISGNGVGSIQSSSAIAINGGFLRLTNTNTANSGGRLLDTAPVTFNAGTFDYDNNASDASFSETVGAATFASGANVVTVDRGATANSRTSVVTFASLGRNTGATLNLSSQNNGTAIFDFGTSGRTRLVFTAAPTLDDGIIGGWATIDSTANTREFVKYVADADTGVAGNQPSATALVAGDYTTTLSSGANPTQNVKITASPAALTGATEINSLNLAAGLTGTAPTVDLGTNTLRVESGGIIVSGGLNTAINNGTLTAGNGAAAGGDIVIHGQTFGSSGLTWTNTTDTVSLGNVPNGTPVTFSTAPTGLNTTTTYFVVNSTATNFQVATTVGGTAVAITSDGTTGALTLQGPTTIGAVIADNGANPVNFVKTGNNVTVLGGTNTYTGKTYVNGGTLRIGADSNLGAAPGAFVTDKLTLSNSSTLDLTASMTLDANRGIAVGAGSNIISIPSGTAGNGRTLTYNGAISSVGATEGSIQFKSNLALTTGVDAGKFVGTLSALDVNGTVRFDAGTVSVTKAVNTIGRSLQVGMDGSGSLTYTAAGGSLTVGKGITDTVDIGISSTDLTAGGTTNISALNLSALTNFTANVDQIRIATASATQQARGTLTLATNNDITAGTQILVSTNGTSGNVGQNSSIIFGGGVNNVRTKAFILAGNKGDATATIGSNGILNLNGFGANTVDVYVSRNNGNTGTISAGTFNLTGGTLNASVNNLVIAEKTLGGDGGATGTLTLTGNNVVSANTLTVGRLDGVTATAAKATVGTLNFGGGTFTVNGDASLALHTNNVAGSQTTAGNLNITGGTFTVGGNITTTTNSAPATATLNLDGGTLDMTAGTITVDTLTAKSGTLKNVVQIFGGDGTTALPLNKTTGGTLIIDGANTYTGGTSVSAGTLVVNGSITGSVTTASGTILGGSGTIGGAVTIASGATLAPGNSPGTLNTGDLTLNGGTFAIEIGGALAYDSVNVTGTVNLAAPIALTLDFSTYNPVDLVDSFTLISNNLSDNVVLGGGFTFNGTPIVEGQDFFATSGSFAQTFQLNYHGGDGNDVVLAAVPEPASAVTILLGSGILLGMRRSRRRDEQA